MSEVHDGVRGTGGRYQRRGLRCGRAARRGGAGVGGGVELGCVILVRYC